MVYANEYTIDQITDILTTFMGHKDLCNPELSFFIADDQGFFSFDTETLTKIYSKSKLRRKLQHQGSLFCVGPVNKDKGPRIYLHVEGSFVSLGTLDKKAEEHLKKIWLDIQPDLTAH